MEPKLKSTNCFSCCFNRQDSSSSSPPSPSLKSRLYRSSSSSSAWLKSTAPEIKQKCRNLMSRIVRKTHHQRRKSAEFRYDPLSYALNFDEGFDRDGDDEDNVELPVRNFSARFPASPLPERVMVHRDMVVCV